MFRMNRIIVLALCAWSAAFAQDSFVNPRLGFGFVASGAQGANSSSDKWVLHYGGFVQYNVFGNTLLAQTGAHYNKLMANDYWAKIAYASQSFLLVPYSTEYFNPFVSFGIGVAKPVYRTGTSYIGVLPFGVGVQTKISPNVLMQVDLFYVYSLSDSLDGRPRSMSDLNPLTNGGNDSFYGARVGLIFGVPSRKSVEQRRREYDGKAREEMDRIQNDVILDYVDSGVDEFDSTSSGGGSILSLKENPEWVEVWTDSAVAPKSYAKVSSWWKTIGFEFGQTILSKEAVAILQEVLAAMNADTSIAVFVVGHTDNLGNESVNKRVSLYRAELVTQWLVERGVADARLKPIGKGSAEPAADNSTADGRAKNRRVEFWRNE